MTIVSESEVTAARARQAEVREWFDNLDDAAMLPMQVVKVFVQELTEPDLCDTIEALTAERDSEAIKAAEKALELQARLDAVLALHVMGPIVGSKWEGDWYSCRECKVAVIGPDGECPTRRAAKGEALTVIYGADAARRIAELLEGFEKLDRADAENPSGLIFTGRIPIFHIDDQDTPCGWLTNEDDFWAYTTDPREDTP